MAQDRVELMVCTKCRQMGAEPEGETRPGAELYAKLSQTAMAGITVVPVECLSNCSQGCTIALRGGDQRWTYIYGRFDPETSPDVIREGAAKYAETADGLVPWRDRPEHFRKNCIARVPPLVAPAPNLGD